MPPAGLAENCTWFGRLPGTLSPMLFLFSLLLLFLQSVFAVISVCHQRQRGLLSPASFTLLIRSASGSQTSSDRGWERRVFVEVTVSCVGFSSFSITTLHSPSLSHSLTHSHLTLTHTHEYHCSSSSSSCEYPRFTMATFDCTYSSKLKGFTSLFWHSA